MRCAVIIALLLAIVVAINAFPAYKTTSCTIVKNDYGGNCSGDPLPPGPNDDKKRMMKRIDNTYSCNTQNDLDNGFGRVRISFTLNGTVYETAVCNTKVCTYTLPKSDVIEWLEDHPEGSTSTCFYQVQNPHLAFLTDTEGPCNYAGKFTLDANGGSCACTNQGTGDDCGGLIPVEDRTSTATTLFGSCIVAILVILSLAL